MEEILKHFGLTQAHAGACIGGDRWIDTPGAALLTSMNPSQGTPLATVQMAHRAQYEEVAQAATSAFSSWRMVPAPKRGELIRVLGNALREEKEPLGRLVSLEMGKILQEGLGEVQEMIDICDFAVGLSRQLYGLTMHSERPKHRMVEQWHPLGVVGIISAFNFPVAVWAWNAAIAAVCGDSMIWKPSPKTPLTALAVQKICDRVCASFGYKGLFNLIIGADQEVGEALINDPRVPLISATGSVRMGRHVGQVVAKRLGRSILELGGNNAILVDASARLDLATRAILFGAVGTAGQRCTSTRRIFAHESIVDALLERLTKAYASVRIGDPLAPETLMGPLIDEQAVTQMMHAIEAATSQGGEVLCGGTKLERPGHFVTPCIIRMPAQTEVVRDETFAPILYVMTYSTLEEAIERQNEVPQGLSSAMFTSDLYAAEHFLSHQGSDCGIANINIGTSGAEIGGAFGGEKETGGGREAGSDAWKAYMRRQTNTVNGSLELPLAQGIHFD
ncbi:aldehyde dehydrogenase family protein [Myxococcota bacterium]|nr:aldehyde dehydrogenase family protein [Myxococcota bacterium]